MAYSYYDVIGDFGGKQENLRCGGVNEFSVKKRDPVQLASPADFWESLGPSIPTSFSQREAKTILEFNVLCVIIMIMAMSRITAGSQIDLCLFVSLLCP